MIEIENKYQVDDVEALRQRISAIGGNVDGPPVRHEDTFYRHPCRDFVATGEALRIRRVDGVGHITYKGPRDPGVVKVRQELEWCLGPDDPQGDRQAELLIKLGFQPVAVVGKTRTSYRLDSLTITIDHLDRVGTFAEIEMVIESHDHDVIDRGRNLIEATAKKLDLAKLETRSYLTMLLEQT